jgi:pimeloyl-ACP methyl ester carboxylesterase
VSAPTSQPLVGPAVLLPGTGSDEVFVRSAFARPLADLGVPLVAPAPVPGPDLVAHHLAALDDAWAAAGTPVLAGGISLGAHVAATWAVRHPERCAGLLLALPAWLGAPRTDSPAALAALASADQVDRHGLDRALAAAEEGAPPWLARELDRAWRRHGAGLSPSLRAAAVWPAPTEAELATIRVPVGVAACTDDPVHPLAVAHRWITALPRAALATTTLTALGADRESLGRATTLAWLRART